MMFKNGDLVNFHRGGKLLARGVFSSFSVPPRSGFTAWCWVKLTHVYSEWDTVMRAGKYVEIDLLALRLTSPLEQLAEEAE